MVCVLDEDNADVEDGVNDAGATVSLSLSLVYVCVCVCVCVKLMGATRAGSEKAVIRFGS